MFFSNRIFTVWILKWNVYFHTFSHYLYNFMSFSKFYSNVFFLLFIFPFFCPNYYFFSCFFPWIIQFFLVFPPNIFLLCFKIINSSLCVYKWIIFPFPCFQIRIFSSFVFFRMRILFYKWFLHDSLNFICEFNKSLIYHVSFIFMYLKKLFVYFHVWFLFKARFLCLSVC